MISNEELKRILENHKHWRCEDVDGWEDMKADLSGRDLSKVNLNGAYLFLANLSGANLSKADLRGAYLRDAVLSGADMLETNLSGADLSGTDLRAADLSGADLSRADLRAADLRGADLLGADLSNADLSRADLSGAYLRQANLNGTNLKGVSLRGAIQCTANLSLAKNLWQPMACPEEGAFIAWKKVYDADKRPFICKLQIPEEAARSSSIGRKCRCDRAVVLEFQTLDGDPTDLEYAVSRYDSSFRYVPGKTVSVDNFDTCRWNECSTGIHFFITREEAVGFLKRNL